MIKSRVLYIGLFFWINFGVINWINIDYWVWVVLGVFND